MGNGLAERIIAILRAQPNLSAPQIAAKLADPDIDRSTVNRLLYAERSRFTMDSTTNPPRWSLKAGPKPISPAPSPTEVAEDDDVPPLRAWQRRVLAQWIRNGRKGIVEAVGGTGKTVLGVRVVAEAVAAHTPVVVVVADEEARACWLDELAVVAPDCRVAGLGSNSRPGAQRTWQVVIVMASTVARLRQIAPATQCSDALLVIDDVDRYGSGLFAQVLTEQFSTRLGLTRALDRGDHTVRTQLLPYFGPIVVGCDYEIARADGLLDPVTLVQVGVALDAKERARLDHLQALVDREYETLTGTYGAPESGTEFSVFVEALAAGRGSGAHHANRYLTAVTDRATTLAECRAKLDLVGALPADVLTATQTVVFTDRPVAAGLVHRALSENGVPAATTTGASLTATQRSEIADGLRDRSLSVLVEQRVLDLSLTVPGAEIALILARTRDNTQLAHRLSRVLHSGRPSRRRLVVMVFASGSVDDPSRDDASISAIIRPLAVDTIRTDTSGLVALLREWHCTATTVTHDAVSTADRTMREPGPGQSATGAVAATAEAPASEPVDHRIDHRLDTEDDAEPIDAGDPGSSRDHAELLSELASLGNIATSEEVGDLIGYADPADLRDMVESAVRAERLVFHEIGGDSEDLLLLGVDNGTDRHHLRAAAERITVWAHSAEDPIGDMYALISDLNEVSVPPHRLVQIAAFLRGTTPKALL
ncbi:DEAD/DEAH box helicase [Nocardia vinacea]|uniref:DEAD/DEAH box helicase n=1 Tax=Nocardia vinacea TaxID=96468 RepID=UPI0003059BD1|nr:DEAD/DEAH box helicase family protein [Nocardia vinacea]